MRNREALPKCLAASALVLAVASAGSVALAGSAAKQDIVDTAVKAGSFNTLVAAVKAAGLVEVLKGEGPFTVFAPSDEAFAKLPAGTVESLLRPENKDKLTAILTYHVVPGRISSGEVKPGQVATLQGSQIRVSKKGGALMVEHATIVTTDVAATNGVIHVINEVMMPEQYRSANATGCSSTVAANLQ